MAIRGARPKPVALRVVDGTHRSTRHGDEAVAKDQADRSVQAFGQLKKPSAIKAEAAKAWRRYIEPASWLDASREPAAIAFCELWAEFQKSPAHFPAAKHGQLRAYMNELGLTDERNRSGEKEPGDTDEFFDD